MKEPANLTVSPLSADDPVERLIMLNEQLEGQQTLHDEAEIMMGYGSFAWDAATDVMFWSEGLYHLFGYREKENRPIGVNLDELWRSFIVEEERDLIIAQMKESLEKNGYYRNMIYRIIDRFGQQRILQSQGKWIFGQDKKVIGMIGFTADITENMRARKELEQMLEALKESNQNLEQFAYVASHDMREPLRKIISFGDRLRARCLPALGEDGQLYLSRMQEAAFRMERLLDDLLTFSRITRRANPYKTENLNDILHNVLQDLDPLIQKKSASIHILQPLPQAEVIASQLHQYFQNVLSNALKFSKTDTPLQISIFWSTLTGKEAERQILQPSTRYFKITVQDNGIGFQPADVDRIFLLFQRLHGRSEYEGSGIGLAICKKIAENHHGDMEASGSPGEGAAFTLYLPCRQE